MDAGREGVKWRDGKGKAKPPYGRGHGGDDDHRRSRQRPKAKAAVKEDKKDEKDPLLVQNEPLLDAAIAAWRERIGANPVTDEAIINPLGVDAVVSDRYGSKIDFRNFVAHKGTDFVPADETLKKPGAVPVVAALSGEVLFAGEWSKKSGYVVFIGGADGKIYSYGHLEKDSMAMLKVGDQVAQGTQIGIMGDTGEGTGLHVHFVVRTLLSDEGIKAKLLAEFAEKAKEGGANLAAHPEIPMLNLLDAYRPQTIEQIIASKRTSLIAYRYSDPQITKTRFKKGEKLSSAKENEPAVEKPAPAPITSPPITTPTPIGPDPTEIPLATELQPLRVPNLLRGNTPGFGFAAIRQA